MAREAGISLGAVNWIINDLKSLGYLVDFGARGRRLVNRKELLKLPFEVFWSVAFAPLYQLIKFHTQEGSWGHKKYTFSDESMQQTLSLVLKALKP